MRQFVCCHQRVFYCFYRKLCCAALKSLFADEGKHGGEVTVEAVKLISDHVKVYDCQLHPDCIEVCKFYFYFSS